MSQDSYLGECHSERRKRGGRGRERGGEGGLVRLGCVFKCG